MEDMVKLQEVPFWRDKRVLVTGHSGFKGSWLTLWLHKLGADVTGISLPPVTDPNLFELAGVEGLCRSHFCDIRRHENLSSIIHAARPEIVFHLAAQPLVRPSYRDPLYTYATNVMGTAHVLNALRGVDGAKVALMVTTDKVYRATALSSPYIESDSLGGVDPYSASKAASEIVIDSYRQAYLQEQGIAVASLRAGNVIGGGDWSEDRLIPDAIRAWSDGVILDVRRPNSIRPWQHVLEPLAGYMLLAMRMWEDSSLEGAYNFGPEAGSAASVREVIELALNDFPGGQVNFLAVDDGPVETTTLTLNADKARRVLGLVPRWELNEAVNRTMRWYVEQNGGGDARACCYEDIAAFENMS